MTALAGVELESLVSEPDALTTRPPPCHQFVFKIIVCCCCPKVCDFY